MIPKNLLIVTFLAMYIFSVAFCSAGCLNEYSPSEEYLYRILSGEESSEKIFFYSDYKHFDKLLKEPTKIILFIPVGSSSGFLVQINKCTIVYLAKIQYSSKDRAFIIDDAQGGVATIAEAQQRLDIFSSKTFFLLDRSKLIHHLNIEEKKATRAK